MMLSVKVMKGNWGREEGTMTWFSIVVLVLLAIDLIVNHGRKHGGVTINDPMLALDKEFIDELAEAVRRALQRDLSRQRQNLSGGPFV